jgi:kynurenine formamidase
VNWSNPQKSNDSRVFIGENQGSPGIGMAVTRWLVSKRVSMVGADSCCMQVQPALKPEAGNVRVKGATASPVRPVAVR